MGWRTSHGARKDTNGPVRIEVQPADELKRPNAEDTDARLEEGKRNGRPFKPGNRAAVGRRPKLARLGLERSELDTTDPEYKKCLNQAESYRKRRVSEFRKVHGYVSVGAMSLIATASLQLAASRYMMKKAIESGDFGKIKLASGLANDARQNELAAWELASREGGAKAKAAQKAAPWVRVSDDVVAESTELNPFEAETLDNGSGDEQVGAQKRSTK